MPKRIIGIKTLQKYLTDGSIIDMSFPTGIPNIDMFNKIVPKTKRKQDLRKDTGTKRKKSKRTTTKEITIELPQNFMDKEHD